MGLFDRTPKDVQDSTAEVTWVSLTEHAAGQTEKRDLEHEVSLLVTRPDGGTEEMGLVVEVPYDKQLTEGRQVPVKVSASKRSYLEIDFDAMPSLNDIGRSAADAARSGEEFDVGELGFRKAEGDSR